MKLQPKKIAIVFLAACLTACSSRPDFPEDIIPEKKMAPIIAELQLAESNVSRLGLMSYDSSKVAYRYLEKKVLDSYGVDTALYRKSYEAYAHYPDYLEKIYTEAIDILAAKGDSIRKTSNDSPSSIPPR